MPTILPSPSPVIAVLSQKGGTGKTTLVRTLTDVLRRADLRVLPVDLDPQANLSDYFDVDPDAHPTIGEVLSGRAPARQAIHKEMIQARPKPLAMELRTLLQSFWEWGDTDRSTRVPASSAWAR